MNCFTDWPDNYSSLTTYCSILGCKIDVMLSFFSDTIHGVDVVGQTDFVVTTDGGFFEWVGYGLRLTISENCLPIDMEVCRINIKASLSGPFQLPKGSELLSPVFWISAFEFQKPVTLEVQYCASSNEADLKFITTKCSLKQLPYIFRQLEQGSFTADRTYGSIQLSHFSGFGVAGKNKTSQPYCAQIYYTRKEDISDWRILFTITQDLDTHKTVCDVYIHQYKELHFHMLTCNPQPYMYNKYLLYCRLSKSTMENLLGGRHSFQSDLRTVKFL